MTASTPCPNSRARYRALGEGEGTISRIDPSSHQVAETITVGPAGHVGPRDPSLIDGDIWFAVPNLQAVVRVNRDRTVTTVPVPAGAGFGPPVATAEAIWLGYGDEARTLTRIDRATGVATSPSLPPEIGPVFAGVSVNDTVWFLADTALVAVDPATSQVTATVPRSGVAARSAVVTDDALWVISESGSLERIPLEQLDAN